MVSGATDINSDPGCGRAMNPNMALGSSPGTDDIMAPGISTGTHIGLALVAALPLGANMA